MFMLERHAAKPPASHFPQQILIFASRAKEAKQSYFGLKKIRKHNK
jgi:hypothetical protein